MPCRDCISFLPSEKASQRAFLEGFGYCNAAPTVELRARFFRDHSACWLPESRYRKECNQ